jgi:hypothetical protein
MKGCDWLLLVSATLLPNSAVAQAAYAGASPEVIAELVLAADSSQDWRTLLQLAHPYALLEFRETQLQMLERKPARFAAMDSCMRGVFHSADFTAQREAHLRYTLDSVFRVPTLDSLKHLRPDTLFARYGEHAARSPTPRRMHPHAPTRRILGALLGPAETAYVLVYEHYDSLPGPTWPRERTETMTLRRERGEWRSMLDGPLDFGSGTGIFAFFGGE